MRSYCSLSLKLFGVLLSIFGVVYAAYLSLNELPWRRLGHIKTLKLKQTTMSEEGAFEAVNARLVGGSTRLAWLTGARKDNCHGGGRWEHVQWYNISDIVESCAMGGEVGLVSRMAKRLRQRHQAASLSCTGKNVSTSTGGYCLGPRQSRLPYGHATASPRVVSALSDLIQSERIRSISDFGAGVGQYKSATLARFPNLQYEAYDGAGDVEEYTKGFVKYFDLALPLALTKTDWVMSLEVGEHIPNMYEGMVIRNLHNHNCKGLVLSWAVIGQGGRQHLNCHSNMYLIRVFEALGYTYENKTTATFRRPEGNYGWFQWSVLVFRRRTPVC